MMPAGDIKPLAPPPNGVVRLWRDSLPSRGERERLGRSQFSLSPLDIISGYATRKPPHNALLWSVE
jgi:hypothetical protein